MSKLIQEQEFNFRKIETRINDEIIYFINNFRNDQERALNEKFDIDNLLGKYSNKLSNKREILLNQKSNNLNLEMNHVDKIKNNNESNSNLHDLSNKFKNSKRLEFKPSAFKSAKIGVQRLINKEYKIERKFSLSQLVKYMNILELGQYFKKENNSEEYSSDDLNKAFLSAIEISNPNLEAVRLFLESGADINSKDLNAKYNENKTALILAASNGHYEIVKFLIDKEAELNAKDQHDSTALIYASRNGHFEIVKYLVENGAELNARNVNVQSALMIAYEYKNYGIVKYLVTKGADVNTKNKFNQTALILASIFGHLEMAKYLVENGADVKAKDNNGKTALIIATKNGYDGIIKYLVESGA